MFTELPFIFYFPTAMFCFTFFAGIIISLSGTHYAMKDFRDKSVASIVKGIAWYMLNCFFKYMFVFL